MISVTSVSLALKDRPGHGATLGFEWKALKGSGLMGFILLTYRGEAIHCSLVQMWEHCVLGYILRCHTFLNL